MKMQEKIDIAIRYMNGVSQREGRDWISPTEIGRVINGGHSSVGSPVCKEMVKQKLVTRNKKGHYKIFRPFGDITS